MESVGPATGGKSLRYKQHGIGSRRTSAPGRRRRRESSQDATHIGALFGRALGIRAASRRFAHARLGRNLTPRRRVLGFYPFGRPVDLLAALAKPFPSQWKTCARDRGANRLERRSRT